MKKADGNLYFRRLFAYILIPFFAGPFSGGLPTPAITMRPPGGVGNLPQPGRNTGRRVVFLRELFRRVMPFPAHVVILLRLLSLALFYRFEALLYPAVYFRQVSFQGRQFGLLAPGTFHHFPQDGNIFLQFLVLFRNFPVSARWSRARG